MEAHSQPVEAGSAGEVFPKLYLAKEPHLDLQKCCSPVTVQYTPECRFCHVHKYGKLKDIYTCVFVFETDAAKEQPNREHRLNGKYERTYFLQWHEFSCGRQHESVLAMHRCMRKQNTARCAAVHMRYNSISEVPCRSSRSVNQNEHN